MRDWKKQMLMEDQQRRRFHLVGRKVRFWDAEALAFVDPPSLVLGADEVGLWTESNHEVFTPWAFINGLHVLPAQGEEE